MKIATWNVNSLRARFENVITWLRTTSPDVVLLQEIKCEETVFPFEALQDEGYSAAVYGQKTYNGVAILSKYRIEDVQTSFPNNPLPQESRYIQGLIDGWLTVASVYVPNGQTKDSLKYPGKIAFLDELSNHLSKKIDHFLMGGDYNIVPQGS
jgi:exodeoxyribonuclease-3